MEYWFLFLSVCIISTTLLLSNLKKKSDINLILIILSTFLIYFSGFRDGLGQDYENYITKIVFDSNLNWFNEPTFTLLAKLITDTTLSPVVIFVLFAIVTILCYFSYFKHQNKQYLASTLIMFCLIPVMYFNTFNLVRQTCASALFFYSLSFIHDKKLWKYAFVILLAATVHLSSIILLPLCFLIDKEIKSLLLVAIAITPLIAAPVLEPVMSLFSIFDKYSLYLGYSEKMGPSMIILLYNVIGFTCLIFRKHIIRTQWDNISLNVLFLLLAFSNLSFKIYFSFRLSVFFIPAFAYVFPLVINYFFNNKVLTYLCSLALSLLLFFTLIFSSNGNNKKIVPDSILPITTIEDLAFKKYYR